MTPAPRTALVTGAAGFIGATLCERLLADGRRVRALDRRPPALDPTRPGLTVVEADLCTTDLDALLDGVDLVVHLAGRPGVRDSWDALDAYIRDNITATGHLLTAATRHPIERLVYASSSSVYGEPVGDRSRETDPCLPASPYGATKLAAEHLVTAYARSLGTPAVSLRFFSVYGPRQRPDMAVHRMLRAALGHGDFTLLGTGEQRRDLTYVDDVVEAILAVAAAPGLPAGAVYNVCGEGEVTVRALLDLVAELVGPVPVTRADAAAGDVARTAGDHTALTAATGWRPRVDVREGLRRQAAHLRAQR